jgi:hypothetical protein
VLTAYPAYDSSGYLVARKRVLRRTQEQLPEKLVHRPVEALVVDTIHFFAELVPMNDDCHASQNHERLREVYVPNDRWRTILFFADENKPMIARRELR